MHSRLNTLRHSNTQPRKKEMPSAKPFSNSSKRVMCTTQTLKNGCIMPTLRNIKHSQKIALSLSASKRLRRTSQPRHIQNHRKRRKTFGSSKLEPLCRHTTSTRFLCLKFLSKSYFRIPCQSQNRFS